MTTTNWRVECGDPRAVLAELPERCTQTCVTTPPAWRQTEHHAPRLVWGGRRDCHHQWHPTQPARPVRQAAARPSCDPRQDWAVARVCRRCGAWKGSLGREPSPELYVAHVVEVIRAVRRVLRDDGTLWLGLRDTLAPARADHESHTTSPPRPAPDRCEVAGSLRGPGPRDLAGVPWRVALALQADGWRLRADVVWVQPNATSARAHDRPRRPHDYLFLLTKQPRYLYSHHGTPTHSQPGKGYCRCWAAGMGAHRRSVWCAPTRGCSHARVAALPERLVERCVLAATTARCCGICGTPWPKRRTPARPACAHLNATGRCLVLDPFCGSGTVGVVAGRHGRAFLGVDPCDRSVQRARQRITNALTHPSEALR